jgi:hypothetical protein
VKNVKSIRRSLVRKKIKSNNWKKNPAALKSTKMIFNKYWYIPEKTKGNGNNAKKRYIPFK